MFQQVKNLTNKTIWQFTGNPAFARAVGKPLVSPLDIRLRIKTGAHTNGKRVAVADVLNERLRLELDSRIGGYLQRKIDGELPERLVTFGTRPLCIQIPNIARPAPVAWTEGIPASLERIPLGLAWGWQGVYPVWWDRTIDSNAHILISGITGSGKTIMLRAILLSLAAHVKDIEFVGIDMKGRGLAPLAGLFRQPLATTKADALALLMAVDAEVTRRVASGENRSNIVFVIDELIDLTDGDSQAQEWLARIARMGRELGIVLVAGMQKPLIEEIGQAKSQFGLRVVGRMRNRKDAETAAGVAVDADNLMHAGTFYLVGGIGQPVLFRGVYPDDAAMRTVVSRYQAGVSVLNVRNVDTDTGRGAVQAVANDRQAEQDAAQLWAEFGESAGQASLNARIRALGLQPAGAGFHTGKARVLAAMDALTTTAEKPVSQEVVVVA